MTDTETEQLVHYARLVILRAGGTVELPIDYREKLKAADTADILSIIGRVLRAKP